MITHFYRSWLLRDIGNNFSIDDDDEIPEQLQASAEENENEDKEEDEAHIVPYDEEEEREEDPEMRERYQYPPDHDGTILREEMWDDHSNEEEEGLRRRNVSGETM